MRSRLGVVSLVSLLIVAPLLLLPHTPASAAGFSARASQASPILGEAVRITGTVQPARRPVQLQRHHQGRWVRVAVARTGAGGRYAFGVRASVAVAYRVYAPRTRIREKTHAARYSNTVRLTPVAASLSLSVAGAPVGQSRDGTQGLTPGMATFRPARPGAPVTIQGLVGGAWQSVAAGRQDTSGTFSFHLAASAPGTLRAVSRPPSLPAVVSKSVTPARLHQSWGEEFTGSSLDDATWQTRLQDPGGSRTCSIPAADRVSVGDGVATLSVAQREPATPDCPHGEFNNAMIGSTGSNGFSGTYGVYAARVKFQSGQGMHGAFWLQGPRVTGAEVDVAEYFGDGRSDGGLSSYVHHTDSTGQVSTSGGIRPYRSILGTGRTPSNGWHVYSVEWSPSGYIFRLDGTTILTTSRPHVASAPEIIILSLLTSDWALPLLKSTTPTMKVDWVRVWQP